MLIVTGKREMLPLLHLDLFRLLTKSRMHSPSVTHALTKC